MTALRALAKREASQLETFRESDQVALMTRLLHTECLLQLARLSGVGTDMARYADMIVGVIEQFLPVSHCRVCLEVEGLPRIETAVRNEGEGEPVVAVLTLGEQESGRVEMIPESPELVPREFVEAVAEQIGTGLLAVVETERLRRQAALADTSRLTSVLADEPSTETLRALVEALGYLPNLLGVSLEIVHTALEAPVSLTAGMRPGRDWRTMPLDGGLLRIATRWSSAAPESDRSLLEGAVEQIARALGRAEDHRRLRVEAQTDPLTDTGNRRKAMQTLEMALALASMSEQVLTIACFDLDDFKDVNDRFGHAAGDEVLVRFAAHLRSSVRRSDTVARIGGDEFLLICPGLGEQDGKRLLQRIVDSTVEACRCDHAPAWEQTASVGMAVYPLSGSKPEQLLRAADAALYEVKHRGGAGAGAAQQLDGSPGDGSAVEAASPGSQAAGLAMGRAGTSRAAWRPNYPPIRSRVNSRAR